MSITPQQAYEAAKLLWPGVRFVRKSLNYGGKDFYVEGNLRTEIDWGDTDQYPPPEPEWVDAVFPDDVGKQGRFRDRDDGPWIESEIRGLWRDGGWIGRSHVWRFCQVRKVKT
jgi:hypothetical protein